MSLCVQRSPLLFQSTPPMQGATEIAATYEDTSSVSIHAPYAGSDKRDGNTSAGRSCFNPRPLCRERHRQRPYQPGGICFNPRPLCRERLINSADSGRYTAVSIHAPYAGSDRTGRSQSLSMCQFQSTPPMQGATSMSTP